MEFAGKWAWKKRVEEEFAASATSKGMKMLPTGNGGVGTNSNSSKRKGKAQAHAPVTTSTITPHNIAFEGLTGMDYRKWWQENANNHTVKASIRRAQVEWAIRMHVFYI